MGLGSRQTDGKNESDTVVLNCTRLCLLKVRYASYPSYVYPPGSRNLVFLFVGV